MSSPFSSALEELDESLKNVYAHIECLGAALDVNDDRLIRSLADARQHAARLRDMLRAERPAARWSDRKGMGQVVQELEVEIANRARRNQQRRDKLLVLATELEGGSIKHRFDTRAAALNALRLEAVQELQAQLGPLPSPLPSEPEVPYREKVTELDERAPSITYRASRPDVAVESDRLVKNKNEFDVLTDEVRAKERELGLLPPEA